MFLLLGATNLQVTTAVMHYGYRIVESMQEGLEDYLETLGSRVGHAAGREKPEVHRRSRPSTIRRVHIVAKVDPDKCIGCGLCHVVCHDGANQAMGFDVFTRKAEVDEERCVGCLLCRHVCPVWDCVGTAEVAAPVISGMHRDALDLVPRG